jgi:hypothetical protein
LTAEENAAFGLEGDPDWPRDPSIVDSVVLIVALVAVVGVAMLLLGAIAPQAQCGGG